MVFVNFGKSLSLTSCEMGYISLRIAIGMICGLLLTIAITYSGWLLGIGISQFHWICFPLGFFLFTLFICRKHLLFYGGFALAIVLAVWGWSKMCNYLWDLNWDGMMGHKEYVMALDEGWNPVRDPLYQSPKGSDEWEKTTSHKKIEWGGFNVRFGYLYQAVLAKATGSIEASKATNLIFLFLPFFLAVHVLSEWGRNVHETLFLSLLISLNPVWILETISFWEDAHFAGISVVALLFSIHLCRKVVLLDIFGFVLSLVLLIGSKRSGFGFSVFLITSLTAIRCLRKPFSKSTLKLFAIGLMSVGFVFVSGVFLNVWKTHGVFPYKIEQLLNASQLSHYWDPTVVSKVPQLDGQSGIVQFLSAVLSEGSMAVSDVKIKDLFSLSSKEWDLYYHIFAAPWFGGFGPWYGCCLMMAMMGFAFNSSYWVKKYKMVGVYLTWIAALTAILWVMPPFFPRWVPFMWLFPVLFYLSSSKPSIDSDCNSERIARKPMVCLSPFVLLPGSKFWKSVPMLAVIGLFLNSVFLLSLNLWGHFNASGVVHEQLSFAKNYLPKPVKVSFIIFQSNRDWLDSTGIEWELVDEDLKTQNYMVLGRTNTRILLEGIEPNQSLSINGKQWNSLNEWASSMNRRLGLRDEWGAWIKPTIHFANP